MKKCARQQWLSPGLPLVKGNVDYLREEQLLYRIDELLVTSGTEPAFVKCHLDAAILANPAIDDDEREARATWARQAMRCNLLHRLNPHEGYRGMSQQIAAAPLYQWFCQVPRFPMVCAPSKSTLQRFHKAVPPEFVKQLNDLLVQAATASTARQTLDVAKPLDTDLFLVDTTAVELNIHFPIDWLLLRDIVRTLIKAIVLSRRHGLVRRMPDPESFMREMNRLCIAMTHHQTVPTDAKQRRKKILRKMKVLTGTVRTHARAYREALATRWTSTDLSHPEALRVIARIDSVLQQLPQAIHQAHERIIGERQVPNEHKILSLYESDTHILVRGKAGNKVEFGNSLFLCEQRQGLIVDFDFFRDQAPADVQLLPRAQARLTTLFPALQTRKVAPAIAADRGFHCRRNALLLEGTFFNAVAARSPLELKQQCRSKRFVQAQTRRSQTEARVSIVKRCFIGDPIRSKGYANQALDVAWAVLAHNLWVLARLPRPKKRKQAA